MTENVHRTYNGQSRSVHGYQNPRLLTERLSIIAAFYQTNHDLAARITGIGDVVFLTIDDPFVTFQHCAGLNIARVRRSHVRFGHAETRPNLTIY